jgi:hypothetical protein
MQKQSFENDIRALLSSEQIEKFDATKKLKHPNTAGPPLKDKWLRITYL